MRHEKEFLVLVAALLIAGTNSPITEAVAKAQALIAAVDTLPEQEPSEND